MSNIKRTQEGILRTYFDMLFPQRLNEREYIRAIKMNKETDEKIPAYLKTFDEFYKWVQANKHRYDLYVQLATVRERNGKKAGSESYLSKRHVLFLDYDKKDYPDLNDVSKFSELIKSRTSVFTHMCVASGHGYHFYICIEPCNDPKRASEVNRALADLVGADPKAALSTQIARIPCTFNHKIVEADGEKHLDYNPKNSEYWEYIKIVNHAMNTPNFFRYGLDSLSKKINLDVRTAQKLKERREAVEGYEPLYEKCFYCIDVKRHTGAVQGTRNFWLGRITNWHKMNGHTYEYAKQDILRWNELCEPPENTNRLLDSFDKYWKNNDYKLLGCSNSIPDERHRESVEDVCDKGKCISNGVLPDIVLNKQNGVKIAKDLLTVTKMRKLTGYHYLLLTMIYVYQGNYGAQGFTVANLNRRMTTRLGHGKNKIINTCMSEDTLRKHLKELQERGIITITSPRNNPNAQFSRRKLRIVKKFNEFRNGYIQFYFSACNALRLGAISYNAYKVYLALIHHLQNNMPCTYNALAEYLDMDKATVGKCIRELEENCLLIIRKRLTSEGGTAYNHYTVHNPNQINGIILDSENDDCEFDTVNNTVEEITLIA